MSSTQPLLSQPDGFAPKASTWLQEVRRKIKALVAHVQPAPDDLEAKFLQWQENKKFVVTNAMPAQPGTSSTATSAE